MGCDGGTIPRRSELVKIKKKPETKDKTSHLIFQWRYCNISQQLLQRPIVTCGLGKLYNKSSIIEAIINKESIPNHIRTLKDTVELNLTNNPEFHEDNRTEIETSPFICSVTGLEMSGKFRFVALWSCGCVFSERALKEVNMKTCPKCLKSFHEMDVVILNPSGEDMKNMVNRMELRKKRKKRRLHEKNAEIQNKKIKDI
ncbi:Rtf2 domain containing protein [Asbolus verrucosus]|uniref:Replication termination factor 2 n=1 Tax=Asbolus verrucosus TaxID=1661398 RepID=A0A482VUJ0_ASBVE|nr:Rtf2 domain containing protein [Asbolus verrucosus]